MNQNGRAVQKHELLSADAFLFRRATTHTGTEPGGGDDDRDFHEWAASAALVIS
jgi:hypothetical protein